MRYLNLTTEDFTHPLLRAERGVRGRVVRRGAMMVEAAFVLPVMIFLLLALIIGGMAIMRYQETACQAREAARWACVRGADFHKETKQTSPTQQDILQQVVIPMGVNMDPTQLTLSVQWINAATNAAYDWDSVRKDVKSINASGEYVTNHVRVTVTYQWTPGLLTGPLTFTSVSELPMSY